MERYYAAHNTPIFLGYVGEDGAREIAFDVSGWRETYGDGVIQLMARRPGEETMYPVHLTEDGAHVIWRVREADVAIPGQSGLCQLSLADGERLVKSGEWTTYVYTAMGAGAGVPAPAEQSWLDGWRTEVAEVADCARRTEECAAYVLAAMEDEGYVPDWLDHWRQERDEVKQYAAAAEASATAAAMSVSRAATRAAMAAESARAAAELVGASGGVSEKGREIFLLVRDLLCRAVYTEPVSAVLSELDTLLENFDGEDSGATAKTLTGIAAVYSGGEVPVGTAVHDLSGVTVTASYSDGSATRVTGWTFLADYGDVVTEGTNTVWVRYMDCEASFTVVGLAAEDGGDDTEVTLVSISATYTGGSVPVGTAVTALTGVTVKGSYSDGSTGTVTGYTLSGTINEGSNTITVHYGGKTTSFAVTGVAESSGEEETGGDGHVVITDSGVVATDDGDGNVTVTGMTATDDGNGNITVS